MATKPSLHAEWDTNNTNVSATTSGHKSDGWVNNEIPTAAEFNYWQKQVSDWTKWILEAELNDGVANYSLTTDTDNADLAGTGNLTNVHTIYVTPTASPNLNGIVGGVDKREIQLVNAGSTFFWLQNEATSSTAANRITLPTHWIPTANQNFVHILPGGSVRLRYHGSASRWKLVSATGCRRAQAIILPANLIGYDDGASGHTMVDGVLQIGGVAGGYFPLVVPTQTFIDGFTVYVQKQSNATKTVTAALYKRVGTSGATTNLSGNRTSTADNPGYIVLEALPGAVFDYDPTILTEQYYISVASTDTSAIDIFLHAVLYAYIPFE